MIEKINQIIMEEKFCVLATAMENNPYCSLMAYAADDACKRLYMVTMTDSEKYRNLMSNDSVSILIDTREKINDQPVKALTITGRFSKISDEKTFDAVKEILQKQHPELNTFFNNELACLFYVEIKSVLLLDGFSRSHFEVFEP
jgi:nitroimidazol reductase NimA-like FMN-containing flavoprotein (pyridoxamine 5'-phosphate oxidase superfamily)